MTYVWQNPGVMSQPMGTLGNSYLKRLVYKGETPFIVPRIQTSASAHWPQAKNIFPDANITNIVPTDLTLDELMNACARRVIQNLLQSVDTCYIWWSGGLDSTAIMCALISTTGFEELVAARRIKIALTKKSIEEYPDFYQKHIASLETVEANLALYMKEGTVHVDGMWADELFGNYQAEHYVAPIGALLNASLNKRTIEHFLEIMKPVEQAFPAETLFQRLWWLEFTTAYQDAILRPYYNRTNFRTGFETQLAIERSRPYAWFQHPCWTSWAITRQLKHRFSTYRESKQELRDYIYDFTHDADYAENKPKVYSQGQLYRGFHAALAEDYTPI